MSKVLLAAAAMLMPFCAFAQDMAASKSAGTVGLVYVVMFVLLFFGMITYFFVRVWLNEKRRKQLATQD